jgi:hypothetical protein
MCLAEDGLNKALAGAMMADFTLRESDNAVIMD